jgi:hypothetical protein
VQGKLGDSGPPGATGATGATGPSGTGIADLLRLALYRWTSNSQEYEFKTTPNANDELNVAGNHPWIPWTIPANTAGKFTGFVTSGNDPTGSTVLKAQIRLAGYPATARTLQATCTIANVSGLSVTAGDGTCNNILTIPADFHNQLSFEITSTVDGTDGRYYIQFYASDDTSKYGFSYMWGSDSD